MRERKGVDLDGRGGGKKLGRTGGEAMIRINYARKKFISNIDKKNTKPKKSEILKLQKTSEIQNKISQTNNI